MPIEIIEISNDEALLLLSKKESHFLDFKSKEIEPAKLSKTVSAFANAEGGEIFVGIREANQHFSWAGFNVPEDANPIIQVFEPLFPLGDDFQYEFLSNENRHGIILHISVKKTQRVVEATDGFPHLRRNAQNLKLETAEKRRRLELDKGIYSFESETVNQELTLVSESDVLAEYLSENIPHRSAEQFIRLELLSRNSLPTVAAILLFNDLPQAVLPDRSSVKLARYRTSGPATRAALVGAAHNIEGALYKLISDAVAQTKVQIEAHQVQGVQGLESAHYPDETLHEIITNAIIHRDYSLPDHVHIRVFDNRVEVESPGRLAGPVTVENILETRAIRNGKINRLINKFPNPPNKDMGEGLNTAAAAMRAVRLKSPTFFEGPANFTVIIPHEPLATAEELILEYLDDHETITNKKARSLYPVETQHIMRRIMSNMVKNGQLERVDGTVRGGIKYKKPAQ
ncbi:hypothetical protein XarbCFBP8130_19370 [Xanthomonas arboricola]|uniref:ATP-binding protein n=1 Tax=Xanthomonas arboricola TaxID=56448 RepID=UPI000CEE9D1F|nr:ATP-binding protein [Xanthomonas arboricola]MBB4707899.1 ATP-dependent DNA helicase RecG [Xanthomonas arboricola]PPT61744.1 hypothetical protein XarbCFBP8130_19370 [Xanthomonas arboricola]